MFLPEKKLLDIHIKAAETAGQTLCECQGCFSCGTFGIRTWYRWFGYQFIRVRNVGEKATLIINYEKEPSKPVLGLSPQGS